LPHPFTPTHRRAGYRYQLSILQAEFALTQVLDRPRTGRGFFEEVIRENLDLGRPDQMQLIFNRRVTRQTPGQFRTRILTEGVVPSLHVDYKKSRVKPYHKENQALRTETTINNTYDFEIGRALRHLPALREIGFAANRRLLRVEYLSHDCLMGDDHLDALTQPVVVDAQRAAALGQRRVYRLSQPVESAAGILSGSRLMAVMFIGVRYCVCLLVAAMCAACGAHETTVEFYFAHGYRFSQAERRAIEDIAESTAIETRSALPSLPRALVVRVYAGKDVIPETGETGTAISPATVVWVVNPAHEGGVLAVVRTWLRGTLLHEFHHPVRSQTITATSLMDGIITEGMATVFERDVAGVSPPWGVYPQDVEDWVNELITLPPSADSGYWLVKGPPSRRRRWIGMRAGAYLVDRARWLRGTACSRRRRRAADVDDHDVHGVGLGNALMATR
jgi:hypothetical protein